MIGCFRDVYHESSLLERSHSCSSLLSNSLVRQSRPLSEIYTPQGPQDKIKGYPSLEALVQQCDVTYRRMTILIQATVYTHRTPPGLPSPRPVGTPPLKIVSHLTLNPVTRHRMVKETNRGDKCDTLHSRYTPTLFSPANVVFKAFSGLHFIPLGFINSFIMFSQAHIGQRMNNY